MESRFVRAVIRAGTAFVLLFLYAPLVILGVYAFNKSITFGWPPRLWTTKWFSVAWHDPDLPPALLTSVEAAIGATVLALVLGSLAAFAVHRFRFFGRETISFALVLPIALPGIVTAIALSSAIEFGHDLFGLNFSVSTIIIGHTTFCIVVVFNNVVARLRRTPTSFVEASMDLGGNGWQTFRYVTLPSIRTALVAGALLAFGLSFDEIVVTNFTAGANITLPIWIFNNLRLPRQQPVVNAVALVLVVASIIPVYFAQRMTQGGTESVAGSVAAGGAPGR